MHQPLLIDAFPQPRDLQRAIPIRNDLLRHRLPDPRPRHAQHALPAVQDGEIVPEVEIAGLEDDF